MASAWGTNWGTAWGSSWGETASAEELIGRRRKRKRRVTIPEAIQEVRQEKDDTAEQLAKAIADLELARLMAHTSVNRAQRLDALARKINQLEADLMEAQEEEEALLILCYLVNEL